MVAPFLGVLADVAQAKKRFPGAFLILGVGATAALSMVQRSEWLLAAILFVLADIGAAGSFVFYDVLLPHVARREELVAPLPQSHTLGKWCMLTIMTVTGQTTGDWSQLYHGNLTWLPTRTIFLTRAGSHAYGLATPESDLDVRGVAIPPKEYFLGFAHRFEQAEATEPDLIVYDIRKFFLLAAAGNPSILELLWTDEADHLVRTALGQHLLAQRALFLSRKVKQTFSGYATAQLKRIKTHRRWLLEPRTHKPTRAEFGLPETSLLSKDILGAITALEETAAADLTAVPAHVMDLYRRERAYHNAFRDWQQYEHWKAHRNPQRAALEIKMGFDGKHASHLVRLMRMCREILETGRVVVKRLDREELLAIRNGAWSYDQLLDWSEREDRALDDIVQHSPLPQKPDTQALDQLCMTLVEEMLTAK